MFGICRQILQDFTMLDFYHMIRKLFIQLREFALFGHFSDGKERATKISRHELLQQFNSVIRRGVATTAGRQLRWTSTYNPGRNPVATDSLQIQQGTQQMRVDTYSSTLSPLAFHDKGKHTGATGGFTNRVPFGFVLAGDLIMVVEGTSSAYEVRRG
jgi:hypothetical protein